MVCLAFRRRAGARRGENYTLPGGCGWGVVAGSCASLRVGEIGGAGGGIARAFPHTVREGLGSIRDPVTRRA